MLNAKTLKILDCVQKERRKKEGEGGRKGGRRGGEIKREREGGRKKETLSHSFFQKVKTIGLSVSLSSLLFMHIQPLKCILCIHALSFLFFTNIRNPKYKLPCRLLFLLYKR